MRAGFFATDITPPAGTMMAGNYSPMFIQGVKTPVKVRAAMFEKDGKHVAFAVIDCCTLDRTLIDKALKYYAEADAPKIDSYIISATHAHSAGAVSTFMQGDIIPKMDPKIVKLIKLSAVPDGWFVEFVARQIATALRECAKRLEPAVFGTGKGEEKGFTFNRRLFCKDGHAYSHPGKNNPDIIGYANEIDPMVGVLGAWRADGTLIGVMVNFCCHGTCYGAANAHGDWIYYVEETLQKLYGTATGVVVLNGPCGDVTQVDNMSGTRDFGDDIARRLGFRVAAEAAKALEAAPKQQDPTLAFADRILDVKRRIPTPESLEEARKIVDSTMDNTFGVDAVFARERLFAGELQRLAPVKKVPLTAIQIGDALFLSNPAEYFTSLSLRIKRSTPFVNTMITELANDCVGYVPDADAFDPARGGGYETRLTSYSCLCPEAGDMIADTLIDMSRGFVPDTVKVDEPCPVGDYWTYGHCGPEVN